jgi:hypothetical protein
MVHSTAATMLFSALLTAGFERLLLLRINQVLGFFFRLLADLTDLFLLLLLAQGRVAANGLHLRTGILFDLVVLLKSGLRDSRDLPAGLLLLPATAGRVVPRIIRAGRTRRRRRAAGNSRSSLRAQWQSSEQYQGDSEIEGAGTVHGIPPLRRNPLVREKLLTQRTSK